MLHKYLIAAVCILGAVYAGIFIYNHLFNTRITVDHHLASRTMKEIGMFEQKFGDHIVSLDAIDTGEYKLVTQGIETGQDAGRIGYNLLVVLDRENIKMKTPRSEFRIFGYQDGELILEIHYVTNNEPDIILHGPFEGVEYTPAFSGYNHVYDQDYCPGYETAAVISRA